MKVNCQRLIRQHFRTPRIGSTLPFATTGIHGLSQLNVWWMRLGIQHQRILPAHPPNRGPSTRFAPCTTTSGPTNPSAVAWRALPSVSPRVSGAAAADRLSRPLPREADHERRHVSLQAPPAVHRQRLEAVSYRTRGDRRRHLVDLLRPCAPRPPERAGLHPPGLTRSNPGSVTHVAGLFRYRCPRLLTRTHATRSETVSAR